jgi:hypothetical protein
LRVIATRRVNGERFTPISSILTPGLSILGSQFAAGTRFTKIHTSEQAKIIRGNVPTSFRFGHLHLQTGPAFDLSRPHNLPQRPTARAVQSFAFERRFNVA